MSRKLTYEELEQRDQALEEIEVKNRQTEQALHQKMRELETYLDNNPHMAWLKDVDSNFILTNKAFGDAVGMDPDCLRSHNYAVCFGKDAVEKFKADDQKVMNAKERGRNCVCIDAGKV